MKTPSRELSAGDRAIGRHTSGALAEVLGSDLARQSANQLGSSERLESERFEVGFVDFDFFWEAADLPLDPPKVKRGQQQPRK